MKKILFVCRQNVNRSPAATRILQRMLPEDQRCIVESAGYELSRSSRMSHRLDRVMIRKGYGTLAGHFPRELTQDLINGHDLILTMTPRHKASIYDSFDGVHGKLFTLPQYASRNNSLDVEVTDPNRLIINVENPESNHKYVNEAKKARKLPLFLARQYLQSFANGRVANTDTTQVNLLFERMVCQLENYISRAMPRLREEEFYR